MYLNWFSRISSEVLIFGFNNGCIALFDDVCKECLCNGRLAQIQSCTLNLNFLVLKRLVFEVFVRKQFRMVLIQYLR